MAWRVYLDASALAKRYAPETGTPVVNHLFRRVAPRDMLCLTLGTLEVLSIFVRKKNAGVLPVPLFNQAMIDFRTEILDAVDVTKVSVTDLLVYTAIPLVQTHSINSNDAVILRPALDIVAQVRPHGDDLFLAAQTNASCGRRRRRGW